MEVINHCALRNQIQGVMKKEDFMEAVLNRAGQIVSDVQNPGGEKSKKHKLPGVEIVATVIANHVLEEGAKLIAEDIGVDLVQLKDHASAEHISIC